MKLSLIGIIVVISPLCGFGQQPKFNSFSKKFVSGYKQLNIPVLTLSYVEGFEQIQSADGVQKQRDFFRSIEADLAKYNGETLNRSGKLDYNLIKYETRMNLERTALEQNWLTNKPDSVSTRGIITVPNGKAWYAWLLKRWVNAEITPDEMFQFGLTEVERVKKHIENIRLRTGMSEDAFYKHLNDSSFFLSGRLQVEQAFEHTKKTIFANLCHLFSEQKIGELKIEENTNKQMAQVPGYYNNNTFYYNLFGKPYNKRQIDWLFIHEGVPGHHYQLSISANNEISHVQQLFFYLGYAEGWAAYAEQLGKQLGVYKTPYDELGRWEWDIVRSVRVPLDIGLNYYGWTNAQALAFWKKNIRNQDEIAMREINRMRRWPAQVITYKYGALQILHWKQALEKKQGKNFNIKDFHDRVLSHGSLPLFMVKENVFAGS